MTATDYWQGKVALVTGGSSGLGFAVARELVSRGAQVGLVARGAEALEQAAASLQAAGATTGPSGPSSAVLALPADVRDPAAVRAAAQQLVDQHGQLDAVFCCAGRSDRGRLLDTPAAAIQELWELNFLGTWHCVQQTADWLLDSRGHLVLVGSLASKSAGPHLGGYPASKFPLAAVAQQLRLELGPAGLHVLLVCPGPIQREDAGQRYAEPATGLPASAAQPGGGVKLRGLRPELLARQMLESCQRRRPELVLPGKARLLFAISQLWPNLGDWILRRQFAGK